MRLKILETLFRGSSSVGEILAAVGGTQTNVSKHLSLLFGEGLVNRRRDGRRIIYSVSSPAVKRICRLASDTLERGVGERKGRLAGRP